jgi:hypothetical protein
MGKRRDNGKWTTPGGHLEADEDFPTGAMRELLEETGIQAKIADLKPMSEIHKLKDKGGKELQVQPFKIELSERPSTSMMNDPDGEVHRWQWIDTSDGLPKDIINNMHVPLERNCLMKAIGMVGLSKARASEADTSDQMYPQLDNFESELLKAVGYGMVHKEVYQDEGGERFEADDGNADDEEPIDKDDEVDSNTLDQMYSYQLLVEGMDWELENTTADPDTAKNNAMEMLEEDPMHYRKLNNNQDGTDDVLAKDLNENEQNPWEPRGLSLDLGSGQTREPGHIGFDTYPYDHGTVVHDLDMGIPVPDGSVQNVRLCNMQMDDDRQKDLLSEIHRVMMPGGQFTYEGPNDIYNYPEWTRDLPGLVLVDHESNVPNPRVRKEGPGSNVHRQTFTRIATPDPATANDAEPRIGVAAYDWLPEDALMAADAMSYYYADATSSGRGNRLHGYASQGALDNGSRGNTAAKSSDSSGAGDSNQKVYSVRFVKDQHERGRKLRFTKDEGPNQSSAFGEQKPGDDSNPGAIPTVATPEQEDISAAFNKTNPNPAAPKKLPRAVSKIQKALKSVKIVPIFKANAHKQIVYSVVLSPNEIDAQDDFMDAEDIEKTAHRYLANSRVIGSGHSKPIKAYPVESFIAPQDFEVDGQYGHQTVTKGSWVLGVKIDDPDEWQKVVDGEYQGVSVGGLGERIAV